LQLMRMRDSRWSPWRAKQICALFWAASNPRPLRSIRFAKCSKSVQDGHFLGATVKSHLVAPDSQALGVTGNPVAVRTKASTDK
jgi:hypothetical protein